MPDINGATHGPAGSPPNRIFTKYDDSGLPVQIIELKDPPKVFFYSSDGERESSGKESAADRPDPPAG